MTIAGTALADGQLAAAAAPTPTIYTTPGGTITYVKSIVCTNTGAGRNVVVLAVTRTGAERRLIRVPLETNEQLFFNEPVLLEATDIIQGEATNATEVDFVISGAEET